VCALVLLWFADPGDQPQQIEQARSEHHRLAGEVDLAKRLDGQKDANATLLRTIDELKSATGMQVRSPYLVPANHPQPGQYFNEQLASVQDYLRPKAQGRSIQYKERLGFPKPPNGTVPPDDQAPHLLTMLLLTRSVADIVLSTPTPVQSFDITQPFRNAITTGPADRPALLREYALNVKVVGSLRDLLWILHQFAQRTEERDFPLIVRGLTIDSQNLKPSDEIQQLTATFEVAAMQFLTPEERSAPAATTPARSGSGRGL
jgi:hypothetical protein